MSLPGDRNGSCGQCRYFEDRPRELERLLVGLTILSSAWGDTRGDQGLCRRHLQLLTPKLSCDLFAPRWVPTDLRPNHAHPPG